MDHAYECKVPRPGMKCRENCSCQCHFESEPWRHPYEANNDGFCIHCGKVGSYIHTKPEDR